jgi:hypothetical protein
MRYTPYTEINGIKIMTLPVRVPTLAHNIIRSDIVAYNELNIPMVCSNDVNGDLSGDLYDSKSQVGFRAVRLRINSDDSVNAMSNATNAGSYILSIGF